MFDKRLIEGRWKQESKSRREGREEKKEREKLNLYCSVNMYDRNHTKYSPAFRLISQGPTDL